jgi:hypothetical protein
MWGVIVGSASVGSDAARGGWGDPSAEILVAMALSAMTGCPSMQRPSFTLGAQCQQRCGLLNGKVAA